MLEITFLRTTIKVSSLMFTNIFFELKKLKFVFMANKKEIGHLLAKIT